MRVIASYNSPSIDEFTFGTVNIDGNPAVFNDDGNYLSGVFIESENFAIKSDKSGNIRICGATISSKNEPLYIKDTGYIYYTTNVKFTNSNSFYDANDQSHIILENKLECK